MKYGGDGASEHLNKHFLALHEYQAQNYVHQHASTVNYLLPPASPRDDRSIESNDRVFHSNNSLWEEVIRHRIHSGRYIKLESFFLFEWIPRSPGLYYTDDGQQARRDALRDIDAVENGIVIYNPHGKASMLEGGIGNYRLRPCNIAGTEHYLMSASSDGTCHEGFPIAVPSELHNKYISEIVERGTVVCTLVGHLKFIPNELDTLYLGYRNVPQLYLLVEDIIPPAHPKSRGMEDLTVSVATTFTGEVDGRLGLYATYINFDPSDKNSLRLHLDWMENEYVGRKYKGTVITDFDQQESHFPNAVFSLDKVMSRNLSYAEVASMSNKVHGDVQFLLAQQKHAVLLIGREVYMSGSSKYDLSQATNTTIVEQNEGGIHQQYITERTSALEPLDLAALVPQLSQLWAEAQKEPDAQANKESLDAIADAEASAKKGDEKGVLASLKKAGTWAYNIAEKLAITVVAKAIEKATGIS